MRLRIATAVFFAGLLLITITASFERPPALMRWFTRTPGVDKLMHLVLAGTFAGLLTAATGYRTWRGCWLGCLVVIAISFLDEFTQVWMPYRNGSWTDLGCDLLGVGLAMLVLYALRKRSRT